MIIMKQKLELIEKENDQLRIEIISLSEGM